MPARVFGFYGFLGAPFPWGFGYSTGIDTLGTKLASIGCLVAKTMGWTEWKKVSAVASNNIRPIVLVGHSMGANACTWIAEAMPNVIVDLLIAFDPEPGIGTLGTMPCSPLGANVRKAVLFHGTNYWNPVGHGYLTKGDKFRGELQEYNSSDLHAAIDDDTELHKICLDAVRKLL